MVTKAFRGGIERGGGRGRKGGGKRDSLTLYTVINYIAKNGLTKGREREGTKLSLVLYPTKVYNFRGEGGRGKGPIKLVLYPWYGYPSYC